MQSRLFGPLTGSILALAVMGGVPQSAFSAEYSVTAFSVSEILSNTDSVPVAISSDTPWSPPFYHGWSAAAMAEEGQLKCTSYALSNGSFFVDGRSSYGQASFLIEDLVFSSPNNDPIDTTVNFDLDGLFERVGLNGPEEQAFNKVEIWVNFRGFGQQGSYSVFEGQDGSGVYQFTEEPTGFLAGLSGDVIATTISLDYQNVPVNQPLSMSVSLTALSAAYKFTCSSTSNFGSTLSFATSGDVFDVPAGVTVNSQEGGIMNNRFGGAPVGVESSTWSGIKRTLSDQ